MAQHQDPPSPTRPIVCYHCGHRFDASEHAMSVSCPHCFKHLRLEDIVIRTLEAARTYYTCGRLVVLPKARAQAHEIRAVAGVTVEGALEANVVSYGPVWIGPNASWRGDCKAPVVKVEDGARIIGGTFVVKR
jgi:uncharacterized CHY-type Zn-finger protein